jgi:archaellum component FlaC
MNYNLCNKIECISNKIECLDSKIESISNKIESLDSKIDKVIMELNKMSKETERMDTHVTFVENIYDTVKHPFHFIMNKIGNSSYLNTGYISSTSNVSNELRIKN